MAACCWVYD